MKSTYKLFGLLWDGAPLSSGYRRVDLDMSDYPDFQQPTNLFDLVEGKKRSILLSALLSIEEKPRLDGVIRRLDDCSELVVVRDIVLSSNNRTLAAFLDRKESQVLEFMREQLPDSIVVVADSRSQHLKEVA